MQENNPEH